MEENVSSKSNDEEYYDEQHLKQNDKQPVECINMLINCETVDCVIM